MVSFWPWKADSSSAASFEKALKTLATKISKAGAKNDTLRQRARRVRVGWTLYGGFTYILAVLILTLVTGWRNWGAVEYSVVAGGPVLLYAVRRGVSAYYDYRISSTQAYLDSLYKERDETIKKLKEATKYDSTQQLLEKYGSPKPTPGKESPEGLKKRRSQANTKQQRPDEGRVFVNPPPTANIARNKSPNQNTSTPNRPPSAQRLPQEQPPNTQTPTQRQKLDSPPTGTMQPSAEFAPNAYDAPPQFAPAPSLGRPSWSERLMDALLGEDESVARNRLALICKHCRRVNGQAPPGTKTLEEVGRWRCATCDAWNGEENETQKLVERISGPRKDDDAGEAAVVKAEEKGADNAEDGDAVTDEEDRASGDEAEGGEEALLQTPAQSTRSRSKRKPR